MDSFSLDETDYRILEVLQRDGRISNLDLAQSVSLSPSASLRRLRLLEDRGVIDCYRASLSRDKLGFQVEAFVEVSLENDTGSRHEGFALALRNWNEVVEAFVVTGNTQYILRVIAPDIKQYSDFVLQRLNKVPGVLKVKSNMFMQVLKEERGVPFGLMGTPSKL
jgi:Lrp/AsnC family transcriptional regulator, leucine-responsive regulatory protein